MYNIICVYISQIICYFKHIYLTYTHTNIYKLMTIPFAAAIPRVLGTSYWHSRGGGRQLVTPNTTQQHAEIMKQWQQKRLSSKLNAFPQSKLSAKPWAQAPPQPQKPDPPVLPLGNISQFPPQQVWWTDTRTAALCPDLRNSFQKSPWGQSVFLRVVTDTRDVAGIGSTGVENITVSVHLFVS